MAESTLISKLNPAVPRRYLYVIAGLLWTIAGAILCIRGFTWLDRFSVPLEMTLVALSAAIAIGGYTLMFFRIVDKNVNRISVLPARACLFAFAAWRGYLMIALMVSIGITLRSSAIPKYLLSIPYSAMGGALLLGSFRFFREFRAARTRVDTA